MTTYYEAVRAFRRTLLECAIRKADGNRTRAALALGLQRTYLLRLIRGLRPEIPPPVPHKKLDAAAELAVLRRLEAGAAVKTVAAEFGVSAEAIYARRRGAC